MEITALDSLLYSLVPHPPVREVQEAVLVLLLRLDRAKHLALEARDIYNCIHCFHITRLQESRYAESSIAAVRQAFHLRRPVQTGPRGSHTRAEVLCARISAITVRHVYLGIMRHLLDFKGRHLGSPSSKGWILSDLIWPGGLG